MFDVEKLIGDSRWWSKSDLVPKQCQHLLTQVVDMLEEQKREIHLLRVKLHQEIERNLPERKP